VYKTLKHTKQGKKSIQPYIDIIPSIYVKSAHILFHFQFAINSYQ